MAAFTPHTFTHPTLGALTGRAPHDTPGVTHFRSIPFASIPSRFRQSVLLTSIPTTNPSHDFTDYGTACSAPEQLDQSEAIGGIFPGEEPRKFDELSCLNLTIAAPKDALGDVRRELPVMVYIHGGAFKVGGGHVSALHGEWRICLNSENWGVSYWEI
jgi:carboxylesterase type B